MRIFYFFLILPFTASNAYSSEFLCITEVRNFCDGTNKCVRHIDKDKSTYQLREEKDSLIVVKSIANKITSQWKSKLVNHQLDGAVSYFEVGGASTLWTFSSQRNRFLLYSPTSVEKDVWSQIEVGQCTRLLR